MSAIEIRLDGSVFSSESVVRAAHRYTADYYIDVASADGGFIIHLTPMSENVEINNLAQKFRNDILDEQLRERIRIETNALQNTLVQAALLKASAQHPEDAS